MVVCLCASLVFADPVLLPQIVMGDLFRFPSLETAQKEIEFAEKHMEYLTIRFNFEPQRQWLWGAWRDEARQRLRVWECLARIHRYHSTDDESRLLDLSNLRDMLGHDDYYYGNMPTCVPIEWFGDIDGPPPERPDIPKHPEPPKGWRKAG